MSPPSSHDVAVRMLFDKKGQGKKKKLKKKSDHLGGRYIFSKLHFLTNFVANKIFIVICAIYIKALFFQFAF